MNYQKHYDRLMNRAASRTLDGYTENHHIIPRCLGGGNGLSNKARLTAEEHYVAHQLLVKIYPLHGGLVYAASFMSCASKSIDRSRNKEYGWLVKRKAAAFRGVPLSVEHRAKLSAVMTGKKMGPFTNQHRANMGKASKESTLSNEHRRSLNAAQKGVPRTAKDREKISKSLMGRISSPESVAKRAAANTGTKRSEETKLKMRESGLAAWGKRKQHQT